MNDAILFVSPHHADAGLLADMLTPTALHLEHADSLREARDRLGLGTYGAVLTEAQLPDGSWTDVLNLTQEVAALPAVLVTHRLADDRLWADVLDMGAYDLLAQPFDPGEVRRILSSACAQTPAKPACSESRKPASASAVL